MGVFQTALSIFLEQLKINFTSSKVTLWKGGNKCVNYNVLKYLKTVLYHCRWAWRVI